MAIFNNFRLTASEDGRYEPRETLVLQPRVSYGEDTLVGVAQTFEIDDNTRIAFTAPVVPIVEGSDSPEITVHLNYAPDRDITVELSATDAGTAESPADYVLSQSRVQIPAGAVMATIPLQIKDDNIYEGNETLVLNLRVLDGERVLSESSSEFTIVDDELPPTISLDPVAPIREGDTGLITARLSHGLGSPLLVTLITSASTSVDHQTDYEISMPTMTIPVGSLTATFEIQVTDDGIDEGPETFELGLRVPPDTVELSVNARRAVTILDDDSVVIGFDSASYRVAENAGSVELTVKLLSGSLTETVTLNYETMNGSAIAGEDYTTMQAMLTLSPGDTEETIIVQIIDDNTNEPDEMFTVLLSLDGTFAGVTLDPAIATVTIPANDQPIVMPPDPVVIGFDSAMYTVDEGAVEVVLTVSVISGV